MRFLCPATTHRHPDQVGTSEVPTCETSPYRSRRTRAVSRRTERIGAAANARRTDVALHRRPRNAQGALMKSTMALVVSNGDGEVRVGYKCPCWLSVT